ncbi:MAG: ATP-binding protein, partial [Gemmatimonadota bacterium]|nr:ATP-binding protein [Gemmatimonadota bacterium]
RREHAAEDLARMASSTDRILESMPAALVLASATGEITRLNRSALEVLQIDDPGEVTGGDLSAFLGSLDPRLVEALDDALSGRRWAVREEVVLGKGRAKRPVGVSITPLTGEGGVPEGVMTCFTDLQVVRNLESRIRRSEQLAAQGELAAGIAHEIRNPLASISGAVQVLRGDDCVDGDSRELMDLIVGESERLNRLIEGFLSYTRDPGTRRERCELSVLVRDVVRLLRHDRGLTFGKTVLMELPEDAGAVIEAEDEGMRQVVHNLVRNGLEAMDLGGILRITAEELPDGNVALVFRDTGEGIPPHELEEIFKPFHTTRPGGTGLGLSIASRIVEEHGGSIRVRSTPGMGTAITVELPVVPANRPSGMRSDAPKRKEGTPSRNEVSA